MYVKELQQEMFSINMILNHTITYISNSLHGYNFTDINVTLYLRFNHGFLCRIWCFRDSFRVCFVSCWCWNLQPWDFQRVVRGALLILQCNFLQQIFPRYCLPQVTTQWQTQGGHLPPLFLDQTKARGAEKNVFGDCPPPLISGSGWPPPLPYLKAWIHHCNIYTYMSLRLCCHWKKNNNNYKERSKIGINLPCIFLICNFW